MNMQISRHALSLRGSIIFLDIYAHVLSNDRRLQAPIGNLARVGEASAKLVVAESHPTDGGECSL